MNFVLAQQLEETLYAYVTEDKIFIIWHTCMNPVTYELLLCYFK